MNILDPRFKYRDHDHTDIRITFAEARKRIAEEKAQRAAMQPLPAVFRQNRKAPDGK